MKYEIIRFKTPDSLELQGMFYEPKQKSSIAIVHIHGWIGNFYENKYLDIIADLAHKNNVAFFSFNTRGAGIVTEFARNGKKEFIGGSLEIFEESLFDIEGAVEVLHSRGYDRIILEGHSIGCQKVIYYLHKKKDKRVAGLVLLSPVNDTEFVTKRLFDEKKYKESIKIAKEMVEKGDGQKAVPEWMQFYPLLSANRFLEVSDPESIAGRILDHYGKMAELRSVKVPVFAISATGDEYQIEPDKKLEILKKAIACDTYLVQDSDHWFAGHENEMAEVVVGWVAKKIK